MCLSALPARNDLTMRPVRLWATVTSTTTTRAIDEVWVVRVLSMFRKVTNWSYFAHTTTAVKFRQGSYHPLEYKGLKNTEFCGAAFSAYRIGGTAKK